MLLEPAKDELGRFLPIDEEKIVRARTAFNLGKYRKGSLVN